MRVHNNIIPKYANVGDGKNDTNNVQPLHLE